MASYLWYHGEVQVFDDATCCIQRFKMHVRANVAMRRQQIAGSHTELP